MFYIWALASVASASKVYCAQKIKSGRSCPVAKEGMLNSRLYMQISSPYGTGLWVEGRIKQLTVNVSQNQILLIPPSCHEIAKQ